MENTESNSTAIDTSLSQPALVSSSVGDQLSFGKQLWDRRREVDSLVEQGIDELSQLKWVLKKRSQAQLKYARELESISGSVIGWQKKQQKPKKKSGTPSNETGTSMSSLWLALAQQLDSEAVLHKNTAKFIDTDLRPVIKQQKHSGIDDRKQSINQLKQLDKSLKQSHDVLNNIRNQYASLCQEAQKACKLADKAKRDPNMVKEKEQQLVSDAELKLKKMENLDKEYQQVLADTNTRRQQFHIVELPELLNDIQARQEARIEFQQQTIQKYVKLLSDNIPLEAEHLKKLGDSTLQVSKTADVQSFIKANATSQPLPDPIVYENMKDPVLNRHKSDDEEFSKLAKKEAIKRAKTKLKSISKDLEAAEENRKNLAVIAQTYIDQPALAQQNALVETNAKLDELENRIDTLRLKKFKYESVLNQYDKKQEPSMPVLFADKKDSKSASNLRSSVLAKINLSSLSIDQSEERRPDSPSRTSALDRDETKTSTFYGSQEATLINQNTEVLQQVSPLPPLSEASTGEQEVITPPVTDEQETSVIPSPPPPPPAPSVQKLDLTVTSKESNSRLEPKEKEKESIVSLSNRIQPELVPLVDSMITTRLNELKEKERLQEEQAKSGEESSNQTMPEPAPLTGRKTSSDNASSIKLSSSAINYYKEIIVSGNGIQGSTSNVFKPEDAPNDNKEKEPSTSSLNNGKQKKKGKKNNNAKV